MATRSILIVGGGTAGWLTAAYLARFFDIARNPRIRITVLESPEIGIIGVGEGTFPTIRNTLRYIGIDESQFVRATSATFKQGIRFDNWVRAPGERARRPFPASVRGAVPRRGAQPGVVLAAAGRAHAALVRRGDDDPEPRRRGRPRAQGRRAKAISPGRSTTPIISTRRGWPKCCRSTRGRSGCEHLQGLLTGVALDPESGAIAHVVTREHGELEADLYIDCSGFRAELIGGALGVPFKPVGDVLFTDRALACKVPYDKRRRAAAELHRRRGARGGLDLGHRAGRRARDRLRLFERAHERRRGRRASSSAIPAGAAARSRRGGFRSRPATARGHGRRTASRSGWRAGSSSRSNRPAC